MRLVIVESSFTGDRHRNAQYLADALRDCLKRGEAPFASHGLYTLSGVLDDDVPEERHLGIEAGLAWGDRADATVVYEDHGISGGMRLGIARAEKAGRLIEYRSLPRWKGR